MIDRRRSRVCVLSGTLSALALLLAGCPQSLPGTSTPAIHSLAFSPSGEMVAGDAGGVLKFLDSNARVMRQVKAHLGAARSVAFNSSGEKAVSVGDDGKTMIFNRSGGVLVDKTVSGMPLKTVAFQPGTSGDTERLATGGDDGAVRLLNGADGNLVGQTLRGHVGAVNALAFGPAGTPVAGVIITTGADGTLKAFLADGSSSAPLFSQNAHGQAGNSVTFSADGSLCPTASDDGDVKVWPAAQAGMPDWMPIFVLPVGSPVLAVAFNPDGTIIGTASADGAGRLWSASDGHLLHVLSGQHTGAVTAIAFNPTAGSRVVVTAGEDGRIVRWDIDTGEVIR